MNEFDPFAEPLRREAEVFSPAFSAAFHDRVMQRIQSTATPREEDGVRWRSGALIAAAVLVAMWAGIRLQSYDRPPVAKTASLSIHLDLDEYADAAARGLRDVPVPRLDQDAAELAKYLYKQVDVLPTQN